LRRKIGMPLAAPRASREGLHRAGRHLIRGRMVPVCIVAGLPATRRDDADPDASRADRRGDGPQVVEQADVVGDASGQSLPPSDRKSLEGSTKRSAVRSLV